MTGKSKMNLAVSNGFKGEILIFNLHSNEVRCGIMNTAAIKLKAQ